REREDVDGLAERLEALLVLDAEALLLVDDDEPEVVERDVLREEPVRPDQDVEVPLLRARDRAALLALRAEARDDVDLDRVVAHALLERLRVLHGEDRRRDEDGDLLARARRLEGRAHGDL